MTTAGDPSARLPAEARARLEAFARALERIHVDDLPLHVASHREPGHRRAIERAALAARTGRLDDVVDWTRRALAEGIVREYANARLRVGIAGLNTSPGFGDDELRVLESLADAVTAIVLWDRIDAADRSELLGLWDRLLP